MARIRTIKPEFPQSESMGRVSRDARLAFIEMWTVADDSGRLRGNSRMLASLLFPYDDDAPQLMDLWLAELEGEGCIQQYKVDGQSYVQICNWLIHQKIDKPSASKFPPPASPREDSRILPVGEDQGMDQGEDQGSSNPTGLLVDSDADDQTIHPDDPTAPPCPHKEIIALYHELLPTCPQIRDWTPARQKVLKARWCEDKSRQNLEYWKRFFEYVSTCDFLVGKKEGARGPFFAPLEWLCKAENFAKVREGRYE